MATCKAPRLPRDGDRLSFSEIAAVDNYLLFEVTDEQLAAFVQRGASQWSVGCDERRLQSAVRLPLSRGTSLTVHFPLFLSAVSSFVDLRTATQCW